MVYLITNTITGDRYIGYTTKSLDQRWSQHKQNARRGVDTYLYRAIRKYGSVNFTVQFLADGFGEDEMMLIEHHQPEYNMTMGGDGGDTSKSPNYKKAIERRDTSGEKNPMYGKRGVDNPNFGKTRSPAQIEHSRQGYKGKRIPVRVNGVDYDSVARAAKELGRSERYVRLHDELNKWSY